MPVLSRLVLAAGLALLLALPPVAQANVPSPGTGPSDPVTAYTPGLAGDHEVARCSGTAPVKVSCTTSISVYSASQVVVTTRGTFTGEIVCTLRGAENTYRVYYLEIVGGLPYGTGWTGTNLAPGTIWMQCTTDGLFGTAGYGTGARYLGVGTWDVAFSFG